MVEVGQSSNGNDRCRTYWTQTMERFFIDLMLDQVQRGSRIGHTFNKQAWTEMLSVFNDKFGSQYDKDVLKSRYTNLWKQFNDVKALLAQSGFSWDETRQMVVAEDDYLWDSYINAHPDARTYKTKVVQNFNDLCLIYGYTVADGRYSRSSHDVDFDEEMQGTMSIGDGGSSLSPSNNGRQRTDWTQAMDCYFIELMLDQIGRGNKMGNTLNKQAWTEMLELFNAKFGHRHSKRVLRHRHKKLSKYYSDVTLILKQEGFSWNEAQRMIVADDHIWDVYTKTHPFARLYRAKILPNYCDLMLLFGSTPENGEENSCSNLDENLGYNVEQLISGERTRTYWTPPMDRYLVDILVDQVHRGNKLGQTFISQAWTDMTSSFNAQFKSCYDKDVLKNRFKHLRKLYNDVKLLLEQSGFSWDAAREIVVAEDHVWDAYTKSHPDARNYRVKSYPGFHKLSAIFGEEQSKGRYSRLARDTDLTCELPGLMTSEERSLSNINWTPQSDRFLIDLMSQQVQEGHKINDTFSDHAWGCMLDSFYRNFGVRCEKSSLEDRYIWLKNEYDFISKLLCHSGFEWDKTRGMVVANDDVWEEYIKENPDAMSYRNVSFWFYGDLHKIFQSNETIESINGQLEEMIFDDQGFEMIRETEEFCEEETKKRSFSRSGFEMGLENCGKSRKTESDNMQTLSEVADLVAELVSKNEKNKDDNNLIGSAINALQEIMDIDDELLLDACDLLEDERKAKTFLALDVSLRRRWLIRKLRPQS